MKRTIVLALCCLLWTVAARAAGESAPRNTDEWLASLAKEIPGLGGFSVDANGTKTVHLVGNVGNAAVTARFGPQVRVEPARFLVTSLLEWRDRLQDVASLPGAVYLDMDERRNRVVIGIDRAMRPVARAIYERFIVERNVPPDAVLLVETDPAVLLNTLRDYTRPVPAGVQIENVSVLGGGAYCSLGFNVSAEPGQGFVTASHCTTTPASVEGTAFSQPGSFYGIADEIRDPPFFTSSYYPGCPSGRQCRFSDSAMALYQGATGSATIAKPASAGYCGGEVIDIDGSMPRFNISGVQDYPYGGELLQKVGRTTGWTSGYVEATCVQLHISGTNWTFLCQNVLSAPVAGGDSGGPVFQRIGSDSDVTLFGITVAGSCGGGASVLYFSSVGYIRMELGPFIVDGEY